MSLFHVRLIDTSERRTNADGVLGDRLEALGSAGETELDQRKAGIHRVELEQ